MGFDLFFSIVYSIFLLSSSKKVAQTLKIIQKYFLAIENRKSEISQIPVSENLPFQPTFLKTIPS